MTDFQKLLALLVHQRVAFIIVGGMAATIHGSARLTLVLDIVYERSTENLRRLAAALAGEAPYLRGVPQGLPFQWSAETLRAGLNFTLQTTSGAIDLFGEIAGGGNYENLLPHTIEVDSFGIRCRCLDLATLIHVKRAAGRPKDLEAIAELEAIQEETESRESD